MIVSLFLASLAASGGLPTLSVPAHAAGQPSMQLLCQSSILRSARNGEVEIAYRTAGDRTGEPLLLIPGSGMQLTDWPQSLVDGLVAAGYYLIMPDLRDTGCSTKLDELGPPDWPRVLADLAAVFRAADVTIRTASARSHDGRAYDTFGGTRLAGRKLDRETEARIRDLARSGVVARRQRFRGVSLVAAGR